MPQQDHKLPPQCMKRLDYPSIHPRPALSIHGYRSTDGVVVFTDSPTSGCAPLWRAGMGGLKWKCGGRSSPRTVTASASQSLTPAISFLPLVMNAANMLQPVVLSCSPPPLPPRELADGNQPRLSFSGHDGPVLDCSITSLNPCVSTRNHALSELHQFFRRTGSEAGPGCRLCVW